MRFVFPTSSLTIIASLFLTPVAGLQLALSDATRFGLEISHQRLFPGDVFGLKIKSTRPIQRVEARFIDRTIFFYPSSRGDEWTALAGVDLETKAGRYPVKGTIEFEGAQLDSFEKSVLISAKMFPEQRIRVDEKYVTLSPEDKKRVTEEAERVEQIWESVSLERLWQGLFLRPAESKLTDGFGRRRVVNGRPRSPHSGVDLKASTGTPIRAANSGRVVLAAPLFFSGNTVIIDHGLGLYTYYGHCSRIKVKDGEAVEKAQLIAEVGATGRVTGPHLHWACRLNGARVNPLALLSPLLIRR